MCGIAGQQTAKLFLVLALVESLQVIAHGDSLGPMSYAAILL
jgi:hypothetical protein